MCDMEKKDYLVDWRHVLLEWANCMGFSKPVISLMELKNGDFLKNLLEKIRDLTIPKANVLNEIKNIFKQNYVNCFIDYAATCIEDETDDNIMLILSVLIHYTCIIDKRKIFTNPLCSGLSEETQYCIKHFLEHIDMEMTCIELRIGIKKAASMKSSPWTPRTYVNMNTPGDTPLHKGSPLQDYLKTPSFPRISKLAEKDKEIKRLKQELQMEKYEKEDLAIELREEKEKVKKISEQVQEKSEIISNLRNDLAALESEKTPREPIVSEVERHLKLELENSQQYVSQLEKEQEELLNEFAARNSKLLKSEEQCTLWQNKALAVEKDLEIMSEKQIVQVEEINNLRKNCNELSALLNELKSERRNNSLTDFETSIDIISFQKNLATEVIDVQLKESQRENDNLRKSLSESIDKSECLANDLGILNDQFRKLNDNYRSLEVVNEELENKLLHLKDSETKLKGKNTSLLKEITELKNENLERKDECQNLENSLSTIQETLAKSNAAFEMLQEGFKILEDNQRKTEKDLEEKSALYENLRAESKYEIDALKKTILEQKFTISELEKLKVVIKENEKKFSNLEETRNNMIAENKRRNEELKLENENIKIIIKELEAVHQKMRGDSETSWEDDLSPIQYLEKMRVLKEKTEILYEENVDTKTALKEMKVQNKALEDRVSTINLQLGLLQKIKDDLDDKYVKLETKVFNILEQFGIEKSEVINDIKELLVYKESKENEINSLQIIVEDLKNQLDFAIEEKKNNEEDHEMKMREVNQVVSDLNMQHDNLRRVEIEHIQEIENLKDELGETIVKYTHELQIEKDLKAENEAQINNLTENIHAMVEKYNILDNKCNAKEKDLTELEAKLSQQTIKNNDLEIEIIELKKKYEDDFLAVTEKCSIELKNWNEKELKYQLDLEKLNEQLDNEYSNKHHIEIQLTDAKENLRELLEEKSELLNKIEFLSKSKEKYEQEYKDLKICYENFVKESELTLSKMQEDMQEQIYYLRNEISGKEKEIDELQNKLKKIEVELEVEKSTYQSNFSKKEVILQSMQENARDLENKYSAMQLVEEKLIKEIDENKLMYENLKSQNDSKEEKIVKLESEILDLNQVYDAMQTEKEQLSMKHNELLEKYNCLQLSKNELEIQLECKTSNFEMKLKTVQEDLLNRYNELKLKESTIENMKSEMMALNSIMELRAMEYETSKKSLENELAMLKNDNQVEMKEHLNKANLFKEKYNQVYEEKEHFKNECDSLKEELSKCNQFKIKSDTRTKELEETLEAHQKEFDLILVKIEEKDISIADLQKNLDEKVQDSEKLNSILQITKDELQNAIRSLEDIKEKRSQLILETENKLLQAHDNAIDVKNDLMHRIDTLTKEKYELQQDKETINTLLKEEKKSIENFENRILVFSNEKNHLEQINKKLKEDIVQLLNLINEKENESSNIDDMNDLIKNSAAKINEIFAKTSFLNEVIEELKKEKDELKVLNEDLNREKVALLENLDTLSNEKDSLENIKEQYEVLKEKYDKATIEHDTKQSMEIQKALEEVKLKNRKHGEDYQLFLTESRIVKKEIDRMINDRNSLETLVTSLKDNHIDLLIKSVNITEDSHRLYFEQKNDLGIVVSDILKQFNRTSKIVYNTNLNFVQIFEKCVTGILTDQPSTWQKLFEGLDIQESLEKLDDLKDNTTNTLEQLQTFSKSLDLLSSKTDLKPRVLKENVASNQIVKEDEWKKKYMNVKQRMVVIENAKNNYEKKIKQLRDENKTLLAQNKPNVKVETDDSDLAYKSLLQQHIQTKEKYEQFIAEGDAKYKLLVQESKKIEDLVNATVENNKQLKCESSNIREAYSKLKSDNNKIEMENETLKKILKDRNDKLVTMHSIKEAYEKLFEENNKLMSEIDTLKYKRNRDREEYIRLIKKEKEEGNLQSKIQEIKAEYDLKLSKMKEKMVQLYKEEVDKQLEKTTKERTQSSYLANQIGKLKDNLYESENRRKNVEIERASIMNKFNRMDGEFVHPRDSISSRDGIRCANTQSLGGRDLVQTIEDRRYSTLPKNINGADISEELTFTRRRSLSVPRGGANMDMEDEAEQFNNKYLADLKEGRCLLPATSDSATNRLSELAFRNSLFPPHLKSSYPAETQFFNPRRFKEDDIKAGQIELDDSMSARLLPYDKPKKKDIGTTSYKKPGPPTPSKHGGRTSLQGNEHHLREFLKETNEKTPKRVTPNRLKALFSRSKDTSENGSGTPKGKRLSIFKKPH